MAFSTFKIPTIVFLLLVSFYVIVNISTSSWKAEKTGTTTLSGLATNKIVLSVLTIAMLLIATYFVQMWRIENRLESEIDRIANQANLSEAAEKVSFGGDPLCTVSCLGASTIYSSDQDFDVMKSLLEQKYKLELDAQNPNSPSMHKALSVSSNDLSYTYRFVVYDNGRVGIGGTTDSGVFDF